MKRILVAVLLVVGMIVVAPSYAGEINQGLFKVERQPAYKISMTCDGFEKLVDELYLSIENRGSNAVAVNSRIRDSEISLVLQNCVLSRVEKRVIRYPWSSNSDDLVDYRLIFSEFLYATREGRRFAVTIRVSLGVSEEIKEMFFARKTPFSLTGQLIFVSEGVDQSKESDAEFVISIYPETIDGKPMK